MNHLIEVKQCTKCRKTKPLAAFSRNRTQKDGLRSNCRECAAEYRRSRKGTFALKTERALDHSRRSAKKYGAVDTLTLPEVRQVLSADHCDYCDKPLKQSQKTLEHVIPFESGGENTFGNVTIACKDCNSKKNTMPAFEFILLHGDANAARRLLNVLAERNDMEPQAYLYELAQAGLRFNFNRIRRRNGFEELA